MRHLHLLAPERGHVPQRCRRIAGKVTQIVRSSGRSRTQLYNGDNELTSRRLLGGPSSSQLRIDVTYTNDGLIDTLSGYSNTSGSTLVGTTQYTYDSANNVTEIKDQNASSTT